MSTDADVLSALDPFLDAGLISSVLYEVKSGKEATVFCCQAILPPLPEGEGRGEGAQSSNGVSIAQSRRGERTLTPNPSPRGRGGLVAAKVYRPLEHRGFRNDAMYHTGRVHLAREGRVKRAAESKSAFGREVQYATWIDQEWQIMNVLHDAGLDVPQPLHHAERAILMTWLGDEHDAAPMLHEIDVDRSEAEAIVDRLLWNIESMLDLHVVHGDLSPYNILYWNDRATIIDFPQAVDPRLNPAARSLLDRDIENICRWGHRRGVTRDAGHISCGLWSRFRLGEIG